MSMTEDVQERAVDLKKLVKHLIDSEGRPRIGIQVSVIYSSVQSFNQ